MKPVLFWAAFWLFFPAGIHAAGSLNGIIFIGQSNAEGQGELSDLPEDLLQVPDNVEYWDKEERIYRYDQHRPRHGLEVTLLRKLSKAPMGDWLLVKYAVGSTSSYSWRPDWTPEIAEITDNVDQGPCYRMTMDAVRRAVMERGIAVNWRYLLVFNGERDARYLPAAKNYASNVRRVLGALRRDLHSPGMEVLICRLDLPMTKGRPYAEKVRAAQETLGWVNLDGCSRMPTGTHYDSGGLRLIGLRVYRKIEQGLGFGCLPGSSADGSRHDGSIRPPIVPTLPTPEFPGGCPVNGHDPGAFPAGESRSQFLLGLEILP